MSVRIFQRNTTKGEKNIFRDTIKQQVKGNRETEREEEKERKGELRTVEDYVGEKVKRG